MKKLFIVLTAVILTANIMAQSPQKLSYQAIVRNSTSQLLPNTRVGMRISILQGTATGTAVYTETQTPTTNINGLVGIEIGGGTGFDAINWAAGSYFIKTETDPAGGTNYTITGTTQLLSAPYALYATKAGNGFSGSYTDLTNKPLLVFTATTPKAGDILYNNGTSWELLAKGVNGQTLRLDNGLPIWGEPGYALPLVTTLAASNILTTAASTGGNIITTGYTDITAKGVCWATTQNPTIASSKTTDGAGIGNFVSSLTSLIQGTTYYVRAYATNSAGTAYGNQVTVVTPSSIVFPTVTTTAAINISENAAVSGGDITATGGAEVTARGICWGTNQNPTVGDNKTIDGSGIGQYASQMTNLIPGTTYYVRAYAGNSSGTGYGTQVNFTTSKTIPTVFTKSITSISPMGAVSGGTITISGGGTISDKGICWGETPNPTVNDNKITAGTGIATFNSAINMLKPNTTSYVRAYAVNEIGIAYGEQKTFTTSDAFYDGFETGFSGTTGGWGIITDDAVEGAYSLKTTKDGSEASLTRTLMNSGQITFYANTTIPYPSSFSNTAFYIDNVLQGTYLNRFWGLQSYPVTSGLHTFKWKFSCEANINVNSGSIDFITMPK